MASLTWRDCEDTDLHCASVSDANLLQERKVKGSKIFGSNEFWVLITFVFTTMYFVASLHNFIFSISCIQQSAHKIPVNVMITSPESLDLPGQFERVAAPHGARCRLSLQSESFLLTTPN